MTRRHGIAALAFTSPTSIQLRSAAAERSFSHSAGRQIHAGKASTIGWTSSDRPANHPRASAAEGTVSTLQVFIARTDCHRGYKFGSRDTGPLRRGLVESVHLG